MDFYVYLFIYLLFLVSFCKPKFLSDVISLHLKNFLWYFLKYRSDSNKFSHPFLIWKYLDFTLFWRMFFLDVKFCFLLLFLSSKMSLHWIMASIVSDEKSIAYNVHSYRSFCIYPVWSSLWFLDQEFYCFSTNLRKFLPFFLQIFFMPLSFFSVSPVPTKLNYLMLFHMPLKLIGIILIFFFSFFQMGNFYWSGFNNPFFCSINFAVIHWYFSCQVLYFSVIKYLFGSFL